MSIEGAFLRTALDLGLGGELTTPAFKKLGATPDLQAPFCVRKFEPSETLRDHFPGFELLAVEYKRIWYHSTAPEEVYKYLGVKTLVTPRDLESSGLISRVKKDFLAARASSDKGHKGYTWASLNNATDLTLAELIHLANSMLTKKCVFQKN